MGLLVFLDATRRSVRPLSVLRIRIYGRKLFSGGQLRPIKEIVAGRRLILPLAPALAPALTAGASRARARPASSLLPPSGGSRPARDRLHLPPGPPQQPLGRPPAP